LLEGKKHLFGIKLTEDNIKLEKKVSGSKFIYAILDLKKTLIINLWGSVTMTTLFCLFYQQVCFELNIYNILI
jgi:hypothetical protein